MMRDKTLIEKRAQETPGADRTRSLACEKNAHEQVTTGKAGSTRRFLRNGFNGLYRALPGEPGFLATIASAIAEASSPT
jgi:hypothetical protein